MEKWKGFNMTDNWIGCIDRGILGVRRQPKYGELMINRATESSLDQWSTTNYFACDNAAHRTNITNTTRNWRTSYNYIISIIKYLQYEYRWMEDAAVHAVTLRSHQVDVQRMFFFSSFLWHSQQQWININGQLRAPRTEILIGVNDMDVYFGW